MTNQIANIITNTLNNNVLNGEATMNTINSIDINSFAINESVVTINEGAKVQHESEQVSRITSKLYKKGCTPAQAYVMAVALVEAFQAELNNPGSFDIAMADILNNIKLEVREGNDLREIVVTKEDFMVSTRAAKKAKLLKDGLPTDKLVDLITAEKVRNYPIKADEKLVRTRNYTKSHAERAQVSELVKEAIHAQEDTLYTVDTFMVELAKEIQEDMEKVNSEAKDAEAYVLAACLEMDENTPYRSEFFGDPRGRTYLGAAHGPNGQASDRSRSFMELYNVKPIAKEDAQRTRAILIAEMEDMVKDASLMDKLITVAVSSPKEFIKKAIAGSTGLVSKPWSFVKAARYVAAIDAGELPSIGMAFGLDAKCSGPQYGSLMAGDMEVAMSCGFALNGMNLKDAYVNCIDALVAAGFPAVARGDIKTPFMGIFYGQGWMAYMAKEVRDHNGIVTTAGATPAIYAMIHGSVDARPSEEAAKNFHKVVVKSFGKKIAAIRATIANLGKRAKKDTRMTHFMPDGFEVSMDYRKEVNIDNETLGWAVDATTGEYVLTVAKDIHITIGGVFSSTYKFIGAKQTTQVLDTPNFFRTAFVNMIQATDALIARLIMVHMKRMGATHIVGIHDCFRTDIHGMLNGTLENAIKQAYLDVFGNEKNEATADLPLGTDILGMFFEGLNKATDEADHKVSQFYGNGTRAFNGIMLPQTKDGRTFNVKVPMASMIQALGSDANQTYYFAK